MNNLQSQVSSFILNANGPITAATAQDFETMLCQAIQKADYDSYLVNMEKVDFLDSTGLVVLISAFRLAQSLGKQISLYALTPSVRIIFDLTQLDRAFNLLDSSSGFNFEFS